MFHLKIDRLKYVQLYVLCMMMYKNSKKSEGKKKKKWKNYLVGVKGKGSREHSMKLVSPSIDRDGNLLGRMVS